MNARLELAPADPDAATLATVARMQAAFAVQRSAFAGDMQPTRDVRVDRLDRILRLTERHEKAIAEAIATDFGHRAHQETELTEVYVVLAAVRRTRRHLGRWMRSRRIATPLSLFPARSRVIPQPLGVVGVISPWNYPLQLALVPAADALAAGNRVMIKPSESTPAFSELLRRIVAEAFSPDELVVIPGDVAIGRAFATLPFDHLFFTGSTSVGREVALAAAQNLTPVTLELGGKSPAIIDEEVDLGVAARRIAFGKLMNAGQTCVAPDYVLVPRAQVDAFVSAFVESARKMYPTLAGNPDYTSIVSDRHYRRLVALIDDATARGAKAIRAGASDAAADAQRKLVPTLLIGTDDSMAVMQEEIFGPVLPVVPYDSLDQAIAYVNRHPRPLALYWFGRDRTRRDAVLSRTISGAVTVNDVCWHVAQDNLPFGGVGASGSGAYHGEYGFRTFSKDKPILQQARWNGIALLRPPYGKRFRTMVSLLKKYF